MLKPVTDRKIRFALVGCGRIAANHIGAIKVHGERCELTDVCDVDPATLADADNINQAYHRFHSQNVGIDDVLHQQDNVVMLWHQHPSDADLARITACLK